MITNRRAIIAFTGAFLICVDLRSQDRPETLTTPPSAPDRSTSAKESAGTAAVPRLIERNPRYQIRQGDVIEITFSPTTEFNQTVAVNPDGYVTLREVGDIYVRGKTVPELREMIGTA